MFLLTLVVPVAAQSLMGMSVRGSHGERGDMILAVGLNFIYSVVPDSLLIACLVSVACLICRM